MWHQVVWPIVIIVECSMRPDQLLASFAAAFNQDQRLISLQLGDGAAWGQQLLPLYAST
jgi:hypothetical protein